MPNTVPLPRLRAAITAASAATALLPAAAPAAAQAAADPAAALWSVHPALAVLLLVAGGVIGLVASRSMARRAHRAAATPAAKAPPGVDTAASLHMHRVAMNSTSDMISVVDGDENYRMVNDAWCAGTGIPREAAIGRSARDAMPTAVTDERHQAIVRALRHRQVSTVSTWVSLPGKPDRYLHSTYNPFADQAADQPMVVIVTRDLTRQERDREALSAAAEVLRCTLEATGDALFATDADPVHQNPDEPVRFANEQLFQLYRFPDAWRPAPTLGQLSAGIGAWMPDPEADHRRVQEIIRGEAPAQDRIRLRDGRILLRRYSSVPMGQRRLRVWSMRDITAETAAVDALQAAAAEQRTLLDQYPGYIAVVGPDNRYLYASARLATLLNTTPQAMVGRRLEDVLGAERAAVVLPMLERVRRGSVAVTESSYLPDGQNLVEIEVTHVAGPPYADGSRRVYAFASDVTDSKREQRALTLALAEAERANRAKSQFLSRMSHELRTPLNAVLGFSQLLLAQARSDQQRQHIGEILRGGRHLLALINDLLDLGRVEAGELAVAVESVPAEGVMADSLGLVQPLAQDHGVDLVRHPPPQPDLAAWADARRLRQVLLNLLSNGIKYNHRGGRVELAVAVVDGELEFRVSDTGPGLSEAEQQRLFQPFERLGATQTGIDGTGIGLALSRNLVEAMGGRIGVHSQPGAGSVFWVRLPRDQRQPQAAPALLACKPEQTPGRRLRALYIEDNPVNQMLMSAMLDSELHLDTAADPINGLGLAQQTRPDLILLDIQLPGIDGYEVLRRLRTDARTSAIPVVAVSANAMPADLDNGLRAGFDAYLTKPVDLNELLATVRRLTAAAHSPIRTEDPT